MKKLYLILILISFSFCLSFMSGTYSRYVAGTTGDLDIPFAKWQIYLNTQDITSQTRSRLTFTPVIEQSENANSNTFAPSSKGYFDIDINPENVDVSFTYSINLSVDNEYVPDKSKKQETNAYKKRFQSPIAITHIRKLNLYSFYDTNLKKKKEMHK